MQVPAFLDQLVLGHSPMMDRSRAVVSTRLTVYPQRRDGPPDAARLLEALLGVWPPSDSGDGPLSITLRSVDGGPPPPPPAVPTVARPLALNIASEPWLRALLALPLPPHVMVEVPAFMLGDAALVARLQVLREGGSVLIIKGRPADELPPAVLACFTHSLIDVGEDRRGSGSAAPTGVARNVTHIQLGVRSGADIDAAFGRGAVAVVGWPLEGDLGAAPRQAGADLQVVMELIKRVDREEPVDRLEAVLKNDPQLAFRLIRYLNSAAFGLRVEITSFRHALMMLGYKKLKRWLALLLASSSKDPSLRPAMHAAVRRGVIMEELVRSSTDEEMRAEMFICGVFSLLDLMLGQRFDDLFKSVPVPERVRQALIDGSGPLQPHLQLVRALESGVRSDIQEAADASFLGLAEINAALLRALAAARDLD